MTTKVGDRVRLNITLMKSGECSMGGRWVYGILSGRFEDLEGQIVAPEAIAEAIPLFLAPRGPTANDVGGPLRWHHNDKFEGRTHELPVGVVTAMWVEADGFTHFQAEISSATKEANDLWALLCEGKVKFGASVGGVILDMRNVWSQEHYKLVPTITRIRIDEISITDNPAFRTLEQLPNGSHGSYVVPLCGMPTLAKSASGLHKSMTWAPEKHPRATDGRFGSKPGDHQGKEEGGKTHKVEQAHQGHTPERHTDVHQRIRDVMRKLNHHPEVQEKVQARAKWHADSLDKLKQKLASMMTHPEVDARLGVSTMPDHVLSHRAHYPEIPVKTKHPGPDPAYANSNSFDPTKTEPRREATVADVFQQIRFETNLAALKAKVRKAHGVRDTIDNEGNPSIPTTELGNIEFPQGSADRYGSALIGNGVTGGYNVTTGGDYLLDNKPAVSYAFYEDGHHGELEDCPEASNIKHLESVKLFLQKAGIPFKVEALQGSVHNDGTWNSESHMRLSPGPGGKGVVEHANQQVIVAYPRSQEELEDVAHNLKEVAPWAVPDIRVVGSTRPVMGFDTAYANIQRATSGPGRFIVLSKSGTNQNFQGWRKAPIQVLAPFKDFLAD